MEKRDVVRILDVNGVPISPSQVQVRFDDAAAEYDVTVPCPWTIDVLGWRIGRPTTVRVRVPGFRIEP